MLTRVITPVHALLERAGSLDSIGRENLFAGPTDAVADHLRREATGE